MSPVPVVRYQQRRVVCRSADTHTCLVQPALCKRLTVIAIKCSRSWGACLTILCRFVFTTTERLLVVLRDGRTMIGYLRSVDQFGEWSYLLCHCSVNVCWLAGSLSAANLLLQDTVERIHVGKQFGDIPRGIYLVRGENVALCGEIVSVNSVKILLSY